MKVIMKVGPRNEEMIAQVKNIIRTALSGALASAMKKTPRCTGRLPWRSWLKSANRRTNCWPDAIYYACGERKEGLEDREAYFQEQMNGDEFSYFAEALAGKEFQWN